MITIVTLLYVLSMIYSVLLSMDYFEKWFYHKDTAEHLFGAILFVVFFGATLLALIFRICEVIYKRLK